MALDTAALGPKPHPLGTWYKLLNLWRSQFPHLFSEDPRGLNKWRHLKARGMVLNKCQFVLMFIILLLLLHFQPCSCFRWVLSFLSWTVKLSFSRLSPKLSCNFLWLSFLKPRIWPLLLHALNPFFASLCLKNQVQIFSFPPSSTRQFSVPWICPAILKPLLCTKADLQWWHEVYAPTSTCTFWSLEWSSGFGEEGAA